VPLLARTAAGAAYAAVLAVAALFPRAGRRAWTRRGCVLVTGTFHNPGWYASHLRPLSLAGAGTVLVVADGTHADIAGVRVLPPPRWLARLLGRAGAKLLWIIALSVRHRPDLYMGYHILPNSSLALVAARLFGRPACYQMTGGPVEIVGGGYRSLGNALLGRLRVPSPRLERLALRVARAFDLVVVRGTGGAAFLAARGLRGAIVPGSVDGTRFRGAGERSFDLAFVGRLAPGKQPLEFVEIVAAVARRGRAVRAVILGDGPLRGEVERRVADLGLEGRVEIAGQVAHVADVIARARLFVLPSLSEGLSIALAEAMMAGCVPLAARVGDLGDLVADGVNGYLLDPRDRDGFVARAVALLEDEAAWGRLSASASASARAHMDLAHVATLWRARLHETIVRAGGVPAPLRGLAAAAGRVER
jgi:glycosyltransferase involved in cell wall biosynthesis